MSSHARTERAELCTLLEHVGPDYPTLCKGWTTYDLAAHLVVRERRPDAAGGIVIKALAGRNRSVQEKVKAGHSYAELVGLLRDGPPRWSPVGLPGLDEAVNAVEFFVHHEDVRRARPGWVPRSLDPDLLELLWSRVRRGGKLFFRRLPTGTGIQVHRTDTGATVQVRGGDTTAVIAGPPAEVLLYAFNRRDQAVVSIGGDEPAVTTLAGTRLGL